MKISTGKRYQVKAKGPDAKKLKATVSKNNLTISNSHSIRKSRYTFSVTVPNNDALQCLTCYAYGSNIKINKLNIPNIQLAAIYGDVTLNGVKTKELKLRQVSGDFLANNSTINKANLDADIGDTRISGCKFQMNATYSAEYDVEIAESKILGNSSFSLHEGDFIMYDSPKIGYNLLYSRKDQIRFFGKSRSDHFTRTVSNRPMLTVKDKNGDISIKD